jgi:hypothetical protein
VAIQVPVILTKYLKAAKHILSLALSFVAWLSLPICPAAEETNSLSEDAYVWQREWNQPVREAVA